MNVTILLGSRNEQGQTAAAAAALLAGVRETGNDGELVFLPTMKIERCRQCDENGWGECRSAGRCVIDDEFAALTEKLRATDVAVFATPVYFGDLSESLRAFLDRLRRICRHADGKDGLAETPAIGICVAGGGGGGAPNCTVSLEKVLHHCGFDVLDMVPVRRQNQELKLAVLKTTGTWLTQRA